MCDLGLVLGLASGAAAAAGKASTARKNQRMVVEQARLEHASQARESIIEREAAQKEAYNSSLERDRGLAYIATIGEGMGGATAGLRSAEQSRQGALSINRAKDRAEAGKANYIMSSWNTTIGAHNRIQTLQPNPLAMFADIAASGMSGYGAFG